MREDSVRFHSFPVQPEKRSEQLYSVGLRRINFCWSREHTARLDLSETPVLEICHGMWGQRSRAGSSADAREVTYDSHDALLSVLTQQAIKWCLPVYLTGVRSKAVCVCVCVCVRWVKAVLSCCCSTIFL